MAGTENSIMTANRPIYRPQPMSRQVRMTFSRPNFSASLGMMSRATMLSGMETTLARLIMPMLPNTSEYI